MGRKKTKAEKIQQGITSNELNRMEEAGINSDDINFLRDLRSRTLSNMLINLKRTKEC